MALSMKQKLMAGFTAAAMAVTPMASTALAQDNAVQSAAVTEDCQLSSQEICDLHSAALAARDYAENNPGVGILIHVGQDFPNAHFADADAFGRAVVQVFGDQGVTAQYFLRQNDARNTVMNYYIGPFIHGQNNGTEVKNVQQAVEAIPDVVGQLRLMNGQAQLPEPANSGG